MTFVALTCDGCVKCGVGRGTFRGQDAGPGTGKGPAASTVEPTISAPVGWRTVPRVAQGGNRPDDVRKIQRELNRYSPAQGGPFPKLDVDGKVGTKTENAIANFQKRWDFKFDGVVDREGMTIRRLRLGPYSGPSAAEIAVAQLPTVIGMLQAAKVTTENAIAFKSSTAPPFINQMDIAGQAAYAKISENFRLVEDNTLIKNMRVVSSIISNMLLAAQRAFGTSGIFRNEPSSYNLNAIAFSTFGGFWEQSPNLDPNISDGSIYFCPLYTYCTPLGRSYVIVHELAHYAAPAFPGVADYSYYGRASYEPLPWYRRIVNADTYGQYVLDCVGVRHIAVRETVSPQIVGD